MNKSSDNGREATQARIAAVRARFVAGLDARLNDLGDQARQAGGPEVAAASAAWDRLRLGLHNLVGGAPTLGLADLGRRAAEIEAVTIARRQPDGRLSPDTSAEIADAIETLRSERPAD